MKLMGLIPLGCIDFLVKAAHFTDTSWNCSRLILEGGEPPVFAGM